MADIPVEGEGIGWLIAVASNAMQFFTVAQHVQIQNETGDEEATVTIGRFIDYLGNELGEDQWPKALRVVRVLDAMARASMLLDLGGQLFTRSYIQGDTGTISQEQSSLRFAEVLGGALIIPTFAAVTIPVTGTNRKTQLPDIGTGLVLNNRYILTAGHVVRDMEIDHEIPTPRERPPSINWPQVPATITVVGSWAHPDEQLDVGLIEVEEVENGLNGLPGIAFRDPAWGDQTYVLGYPAVPTSDDVYLASQQGSVVSPGSNDVGSERELTTHRGEVVAPSISSYMTDVNYFYYSAIARPGNSGGPIIAQDGRVVGLVSDSTFDKGKPGVERFYRGVPTRQIVRALSEPPLAEQFSGGELPIVVEDWRRN
jgi:S1-C subfamily serine protease